ncbi:hypothetical protein LA080_013641 [Diaporthe eres]|nr:hypothetical protein LA080_013641 [Diaporthe eres]
MGADNKNRNYVVHQPFHSDCLSEAPSYSTEDKNYYPSDSLHVQDEDTYIPPSDLPRSNMQDIRMYEMESVPHRILLKEQLADERSRRTKHFVTTLVLSLVLGICLIGFAVFLILYGLELTEL